MTSRQPKKSKSLMTTAQAYPRITDENDNFYGCLDESTLVPHTYKIGQERLKELIESAITNANSKSSRAILSIPFDTTQEEIDKTYEKEGRELFKYFKKYCGDPASTAFEIFNKHYKQVAKEQFRNRTLQKQRMNSGWRYQYLAKECAQESRRFRSVSDIGAAEADFNATIEFLDKALGFLNLYVSIKNRSNTMGGQDWPKAIAALEEVAKSDKNKIGPYCCVFGLAMERGFRNIKVKKGTKIPHSSNTEVWYSDFFWPFFANYSYKDIMTAVLDVLISVEPGNDEELSSLEEIEVANPEEIEVPELLIKSFGKSCEKAELVDSSGRFNNPHKLVSFFCNK